MASAPTFAVIPGAQVHALLDGRETRLVGIVEQAYRRHGARDTVNPSSLLPMPDRPPNVAAGLPRAPAVLVLNDPTTGHPYACLESSIISAVRTAASAALAADRLTRTRCRPARLAVVGTGLIARYTHRFLTGTGWEFDEINLYDVSVEHAADFADHLGRAGHRGRVVTHEDPEPAIRGAGLVLFTTVAGQPHVHDPGWFAHAPVVLHLSLRDLAPQVLLAGDNIVDDVDHAQRERTSTALAEEFSGGREFISGTLHDVLTGAVKPRADRPVFFSPGGLGVLDLAVGRYVYQTVAERGELRTVDGLFDDRWRSPAPPPAGR